MKKVFLILVLLAILIGGLGFACYAGRTSVLAYLMRSQLGVPVSMESLEITQQNAMISRLWIGNPPPFKSQSAFTAGSIEIDSTYSQMMGNPLIIDAINIADINIYLEENNTGKTNWDTILKSSAKPSNRHYLIRNLVLTNLTVQLIQPDGKIKRYPTLARLEFQNISDETGFPVSEIEKAIFNQVLKNLYQQLDIQNTLKQLIPGGNYIPNIPFFK